MEIRIDDRHAALERGADQVRAIASSLKVENEVYGMSWITVRAPSLSATFTILFCCVKLSVPKTMNAFAGSNAASIATQPYSVHSGVSVTPLSDDTQMPSPAASPMKA